MDTGIAQRAGIDVFDRVQRGVLALPARGPYDCAQAWLLVGINSSRSAQSLASALQISQQLRHCVTSLARSACVSLAATRRHQRTHHAHR